MLDIERADCFHYIKNLNTRTLGETCKERKTHYEQYRNDDSLDQMMFVTRGFRRWCCTNSYPENSPNAVIDLKTLGFLKKKNYYES